MIHPTVDPSKSMTHASCFAEPSGENHSSMETTRKFWFILSMNFLLGVVFSKQTEDEVGRWETATLVSNIHFVPVQLCQRQVFFFVFLFFCFSVSFDFFYFSGHVNWAQIVCRMLEGLGNELYAVPVLVGTVLSSWEKEGDASFGQCLPQSHAGVRMTWHLTFSFLSLVWKHISLSNPTKISRVVF